MKIKTGLYFFSKNLQKKAEQYDYNAEETGEDMQSFYELHYTDSSSNDLTMDVHRPKWAEGEKLPVIIMVHGGGLFVGDRKMVRGFCKQMADRGFLVFNLSYRLLTEANACEEMADVCNGIRYAGEMIDHCCGDRNRVYLAAESAGVYLSLYAVASHKNQDIRKKTGCPDFGLEIRKMACISGMYYTKRLDLIGLVYPMQIYGKRCLDLQFMKYMNPENQKVMNTLPPMLLVSADADFLKKYTKNYYEALCKADKKCKLIYYTENKNLTHAFPVYKYDLPESIEVMDIMCSYFLGGD